MKRLFVLLLALGALGATASAQAADAALERTFRPPQSPISGEFVARVQGTDSFAGIVVGQGRALAYVCNGTDAGVSTYQWFRGRLRNDTITLKANGLRLTLRLTDAGGSGTFQDQDGKSHVFRLRQATGNAGLYRAAKRKNGRLIQAGWIVLPGGGQRGSVSIQDGTSNTVVEPAPRLDSGQASITIDGLGRVAVQRLTSSIIAILIG